MLLPAMMKSSVAIGYLAVTGYPVALIASPAPSSDGSRGSLRLQFESWIEKHNKAYLDDEHEFSRRFEIFAANSEAVARHNGAYRLGVTSYAMSLEGPFADMNDEEFKSQYLMQPQKCHATTHTSSGRAPRNKPKSARPDSVDWRTKGVVTPVKDQGGCGSCWAFSTTGSLEAHLCIENHKDCSRWTGLSEQQLVDCAKVFNNNGCNGGLPSQAFEYVYYNGGIDTEDSYIYKAKDGTCAFSHKNVGAKVSGVFNITAHDEDEIVTAVAEVGPVSVAYQVSPDFRLYSHGVYDSYNATTKQPVCHDDVQHVNHAVVVVGYGETTPTPDQNETIPFHIIRNSWSNSWGMEGYFWMVRGKNMCGVSVCASYPLISRERKKNVREKVKQVSR